MQTTFESFAPANPAIVETNSGAEEMNLVGDLVHTFAVTLSAGLGVSLAAASVVVLAGFVA